MNSQLGLLHVWTQGDWVTRIVFAALLLMSLASWIVILLKALGVVQAKRQAARVEGFWHSSDMAEGLSKLGADDANPFRDLAIEGREAAAHHRATKAQLHDSLDASDWISRSLRNSIDATTGKLQSGLAILASVGSTAPFVGLFGTVWGIMRSFTAIAAENNSSLAVVAPGIAEALFATAIGLFAAIPAVIAYNAFSQRLSRLESRLGRFADGLHATFSRELEADA